MTALHVTLVVLLTVQIFWVGDSEEARGITLGMLAACVAAAALAIDLGYFGASQ